MGGQLQAWLQSGYRRLEKQLENNFWRVQPSWSALGAGPKRLAGLTVTPRRGQWIAPPPPPSLQCSRLSPPHFGDPDAVAVNT